MLEMMDSHRNPWGRSLRIQPNDICVCRRLCCGSGGLSYLHEIDLCPSVCLSVCLSPYSCPIRLYMTFEKRITDQVAYIANSLTSSISTRISHEKLLFFFLILNLSQAIQINKKWGAAMQLCCSCVAKLCWSRNSSSSSTPRADIAPSVINDPGVGCAAGSTRHAVTRHDLLTFTLPAPNDLRAGERSTPRGQADHAGLRGTRWPEIGQSLQARRGAVC